MGTTSTVKFYDNDEPICAVCHQFDGYYSGVGMELANWLADKVIINGFSVQTMEAGFANGMGCLAAQYVAYKKTQIGKCYMTAADDVQDYNYNVRYDTTEKTFKISVNDFDGTPKEFLQKINSDDDGN